MRFRVAGPFDKHYILGRDFNFRLDRVFGGLTFASWNEVNTAPENCAGPPHITGPQRQPQALQHSQQP